MAILYRLGIGTQTTTRLVIRGETNGVITITCNGSSQNATIATGTHDGIVAVDITGLTAGGSYPFTITDVGGTAYTGTLKTMPTSGFELINFSCDDPATNCPALYREAGVDCAISTGDTPYLNSSNSGAEWGGITGLDGSQDTIASSADTDNYLAHHLRQWYKPPYRYLIERVPFGYMPDDHEHPTNNFAPDQTGLTDLEYVNFINGETSGTNIYDAATPANGVAEIAAAEAAAQAAMVPYTYGNNSDTGQMYFNFRPNDDVEVFVLDCVSFKNAEIVADSTFAAKYILGTTQRAWLIAALAASTSTFKIICSPKRAFDGSIHNDDGWINYTKEMDEILTQIASVTGVIWLCGDKHNSGVFAAETPTDTYNHVSFAGCPLSKTNHNQGTWHAYQKLELGSIATVPPINAYNKVIIPPGGAYAELQIVNVNGSIIARERVLAGTNTLQTRSDYEKYSI